MMDLLRPSPRHVRDSYWKSNSDSPIPLVSCVSIENQCAADRVRQRAYSQPSLNMMVEGVGPEWSHSFHVLFFLCCFVYS